MKLSEIPNYKAINWNAVNDMVDKLTWDKLCEQFWLDTRIPISNDLDDWRVLPSNERDMLAKVLGGLTLLDTVQSQDGNLSMHDFVRTPHEEAVINNIAFMESVHAKSYSSIFSTLNTKQEIEEVFQWVDNNELLQFKAKKINDVYQNGTGLQRKIASVFLESFLFYSGFYAPLYYGGTNKMSNVAEVISLILRDESVHGTFLGYKAQLAFNELPESEQQEVQDWAFELLFELYNNEVKYAELLYDEIGWTEDVKTFLRYNANKALMNLGFDPLFEDTAEDVNPVVMNGINTSGGNHDFFSAVGSNYLMGELEAMSDSDYDY